MSGWATSPQAAQIDALIERADRVTEDECDSLSAAWRAAWGLDTERAIDAALNAVRSAGFNAICSASAASGAVFRAVWDADEARSAGCVEDADESRSAGCAALALVVRDLIDEATEWNQAAYDRLTVPWRWTIGSVHPDDQVLR